MHFQREIQSPIESALFVCLFKGLFLCSCISSIARDKTLAILIRINVEAFDSNRKL